jgi:hypothetical protein
MASRGACPTANAEDCMMQHDGALYRDLANRQTAAAFYAAAALRWLDRDMLDAAAAQDSIRGMIEQLRRMEALIESLTHSLTKP